MRDGPCCRRGVGFLVLEGLPVALLGRDGADDRGQLERRQRLHFGCHGCGFGIWDGRGDRAQRDWSIRSSSVVVEEEYARLSKSVGIRLGIRLKEASSLVVVVVVVVLVVVTLRGPKVHEC